MGGQDFQLELESLDRAVDQMSALVVDEVTALSRDFLGFLQGLDRDAWSTEDACQDFGNAYVETIEAFDQVLQGVKKDVIRYRDELDDTVSRYRGQDASVQFAMNLSISHLDDVMAGDQMGRIAYGQRPVLDDQRDAPATAPADTSPGQ